MNNLHDFDSDLNFSTMNCVEFKADKPIDKNDLDVVIMYLENPKLSGGGNIISYELDPNMRALIVNYEQKLFKHRVLAKKCLFFHGYSFLTNDLEDDDFNYKLDDCGLILKNVTQIIELSVVKLFAESLVLTDNILNEVDSINHSNYFNDTYYVRFKSEIDFEQCKQRLMRRPTLHEKPVQIMQAYVTNSIFFSYNGTPNMINEIFMNKKKYPENPVLSIKEIEPFLILKFDSKINLEKFLVAAQKEKLTKRIAFENVINFVLLKEAHQNIPRGSLTKSLDHLNNLPKKINYDSREDNGFIKKFERFKYCLFKKK